jgi:hypothetical protein
VGKRRLTYVRNSDWLIPPSKPFGKTEKNFSMLLNKTDHELSDYGSLNESDIDEVLLNGSSNKEVRMYQ